MPAKGIYIVSSNVKLTIKIQGNFDYYVFMQPNATVVYESLG